MATNITLKGAKALTRQLRRMGDKVARKGATNALKEGAKPIREEVRYQAPVDKGNLRRSIKSKISKRRKTEQEVMVGPDPSIAPKAKFPQFGTKYQDPQPYLTTGFDLREDEAIKDIEEQLGKEIDKSL
jgi:HK97 gp10 family phage protein